MGEAQPTPLLTAAQGSAWCKVEIQPAIASTSGNKYAQSPTMNTANLGRRDGSRHFSAEAGVSKNTWTVENVWHAAPEVINAFKIFMAFNYTVLLKAPPQL